MKNSSHICLFDHHFSSTYLEIVHTNSLFRQHGGKWTPFLLLTKRPLSAKISVNPRRGVENNPGNFGLFWSFKIICQLRPDVIAPTYLFNLICQDFPKSAINLCCIEGKRISAVSHSETFKAPAPSSLHPHPTIAKHVLP